MTVGTFPALTQTFDFDGYIELSSGTRIYGVVHTYAPSEQANVGFSITAFVGITSVEGKISIHPIASIRKIVAPASALSASMDNPSVYADGCFLATVELVGGHTIYGNLSYYGSSVESAIGFTDVDVMALCTRNNEVWVIPAHTIIGIYPT